MAKVGVTLMPQNDSVELMLSDQAGSLFELADGMLLQIMETETS
jgi:hypothetical protein